MSNSTSSTVVRILRVTVKFPIRFKEHGVLIGYGLPIITLITLWGPGSVGAFLVNATIRLAENFHVSHISSRIVDNVIAKWTFCVEQFFFSKVAIIKAKSATIAFFSSSSLLSLSFSPFLNFPSLL